MSSLEEKLIVSSESALVASPLPDILAEAKRIVIVARNRGVTLRLLGGVAFRLRCPSSSEQNLTRPIADIDFFGKSRERSSIDRLFRDIGYTAGLNAIRYDRLLFYDEKNRRKVDVFLNIFNMCHKILLKDRLQLDEITLTLADLLLTKLQVFEFTEKEYKDSLALLKDYEFSREENKNAINLNYIAKLCSRDWGLFRTLTMNLERLQVRLPNYFPEPEEQSQLKKKIVQLRDLILVEPKSLGWKSRAIVGERMKWYELPSEPAPNAMIQP